MPVTRPVTKPVPRILTASLLALLSACGSNSDNASLNQAPAAIATATTTLSADVAQLPETAAAQIAQPTFHVAPVLLDTPTDIDAFNRSASALMGPRQQAIPEEFQQLSDRGLTVTAMQEVQAQQGAQGARVRSLPGNSVIQPQATSSVVSTYTPAQIRAAYGLAALPASMTGLTAAQAAQLGAGQTIYIVDAYHDPNVAAELAAFNQKFGLPGCTAKTLAATSALPLAAPATNACELVLAYNTASGTLTGTAPAYNSGWATEITLDVQWAHATAPLARIVLIEAADASLNSLLGAVKLANAMGPGVVSMSFGAAEGNWTASVDAAFSAAKMTYLAAARGLKAAGLVLAAAPAPTRLCRLIRTAAFPAWARSHAALLLTLHSTQILQQVSMWLSSILAARPSTGSAPVAPAYRRHNGQVSSRWQMRPARNW